MSIIQHSPLQCNSTTVFRKKNFTIWSLICKFCYHPFVLFHLCVGVVSGSLVENCLMRLWQGSTTVKMMPGKVKLKWPVEYLEHTRQSYSIGLLLCAHAHTYTRMRARVRTHMHTYARTYISPQQVRAAGVGKCPVLSRAGDLAPRPQGMYVSLCVCTKLPYKFSHNSTQLAASFYPLFFFPYFWIAHSLPKMCVIPSVASHVKTACIKSFNF